MGPSGSLPNRATGRDGSTSDRVTDSAHVHRSGQHHLRRAPSCYPLLDEVRPELWPGPLQVVGDEHARHERAAVCELPRLSPAHDASPARGAGEPSGAVQVSCWRVRRAERMAKLHAATYVRLAATPIEDQLSRVCTCPHCQRDGQHLPQCSVHGSADDPDVDGPCDCGRTSRP